MTRRKRRLKKQVWYVLVVIIFAFVAYYSYKNIKAEMDYKKTYEYRFIEVGYTKEEYEEFKEIFGEEQLEEILKLPQEDLYLNFARAKYFIKDNFYTYLDYYNKGNITDIDTIIRKINTHTDVEFYEAGLKANVDDGYSMLVNKQYILPSDYEPSDLVSVPITYAWGNYGDVKVQQVAYDAFLNMWSAANEEGYYLMVKSGYRSYQEQEEVYNNYYERYGSTYADGIAARAGHSEHQTGLVLDIYSKENSNQKTFGDSQTAAWLRNNAHRFGFILRYDSDVVDITGYEYEPWHFRYVGVDIATQIFNEDITFEEYYAYYIEK